MKPGIINFGRKLLNQAVAASTVLVDCTDITTAIAANQVLKLKVWLPFTLGATGGFKFQLVVPAGGTSFLASLQVVDGTAAAPGNEVATVQTASAAFANAFAVAGTHYLQLEATIVNGATAGNVTLQFACNSAANSITALAGSTIETVVL